MPPKKSEPPNGDVKIRAWRPGGTSTRIIAGDKLPQDTRTFRSKQSSIQTLFPHIRNATTSQQRLLAIKNYLVQSYKGGYRRRFTSPKIRDSLKPWIDPLLGYIARIRSFDTWKQITEHVSISRRRGTSNPRSVPPSGKCCHRPNPPSFPNRPNVFSISSLLKWTNILTI